MWTNQVIVQVSLCVVLLSVAPSIAQHHINVHSHRSLNRQPKIQLVETNDALVEHFHPRWKRNVEPHRARRDVETPQDPADREKADADFRRELRALLRNTRGTYAAVTELMNRKHTEAKKKMFVMQDPILMKHLVNSEQMEQLLKSSAELARDGTRLPLWGVPTPKGFSPVDTSPVDMVRELRALFRNSRGTYATTVLMNREHTKEKKKMFVMPEKIMMERMVNSEQLEEIIKSSEERNTAVWPLIGMTTPNYTITTVAIDFIRELRAVFRNTRGTYATPDKPPHQAVNTGKRRKLGVAKNPEMAKHQVDSRQFAEILKSSEERANPTTFPLIGC